MIEEYHYGERSTLRKGSVFRATGGPVFQGKDGSRFSLAARGPFTFESAERHGETVYLHARDRDGNHAVLHVSGERTPPDPCIVPSPYQIKARLRPKTILKKLKRRV